MRIGEVTELITRHDAKKAGLVRYFTGEACSHGHVAERRVSDRTCVECSRLKSADPMSRERRREYMAVYKATHKDRQKELNKAYYDKNAEQFREYAKQYRQENAEEVRAKDAERNALPERIKAQSQANAKRYVAKGEAIRKREQLRYIRESDRIKARVLEYKKANPEKVKAAMKAGVANRRARERSAEGKASGAIVLQLYDDQQGVCAFCSADLSLLFHVDHILPLKRGGSNNDDNLQLLCATCNQSKGAKTLDEYAEYSLQKLKFFSEQLKMRA
jgi:5-methylcytosine-specific restriction endonuclease McrA